MSKNELDEQLSSQNALDAKCEFGGLVPILRLTRSVHLRGLSLHIALDSKCEPGGNHYIAGMLAEE